MRNAIARHRGLYFGPLGGGPFFVLGVLQRGRIAEGLGERQKARDSYRFVTDVWRHAADPELEPYVREARAGLERLAAEG